MTSSLRLCSVSDLMDSSRVSADATADATCSISVFLVRSSFISATVCLNFPSHASILVSSANLLSVCCFNWISLSPASVGTEKSFVDHYF